MHPEVSLLYRIILVILGFLFVHMKLSIVLSRSVKNCTEILMGIVLNMSRPFDGVAILLILPIQGHEIQGAYLIIKGIYSKH